MSGNLRTINIDIHNNVIKIPLINFNKKIENWTIVSMNDYPKISSCKFHIYKRRDGKFYASSTINGTNVPIHQLILGKAPEGCVIDHINNNGLDNRRSNLRFATFAQNSQNRLKKMGKYSSDYTGVTYCHIYNNYRSTISYKGKYIHIKRFSTEIEAAKAYDIYAIHYYGVHSKTNNLLTKEEIYNITTNGIPDKYKKKTRKFPKNIYSRGNIYSYDVTRDGKRYYESFPTLEKAIEAKNNLVSILDQKIRDEKISNIGEITRNKNGVAVVYLRNKNGDIIEECLVDDDKWMDLSMWKWCYRNDR